MDSDFRAYDEVSSVLKVLDIILCWFDDDFGFSSVFEKRDIQILYHQFRQTESLLTYSTDEYFLPFRVEIAGIAYEIREYIVSKAENFFSMKIQEQATSSTAQSTSINLPKKMLRISKREEHFVLCDAVVSLLHDLELILSSHGHTCDSEQQFRIGDIQIMYDNLSMMDFLLIDSLGHGYDKTLMYGLGHWVGFVAYGGRDYIDLWPLSLIEKQSTGSCPPSKHKFDDQLNKLTQSMEYVNRELIGLTERQPTGSFPPSSEHIFDYNLCEMTQSLEHINQELIVLTEKQPTGFFPPISEHIELHGTTSTDGGSPSFLPKFTSNNKTY